MKTFKNQNSEFSLIEQKSKFIALGYFVKDDAEVKNILEILSKKYNDAKHVCYAYIFDDNNFYYYDDGEPKMTAGKPIYDAIKFNNLNYSLIVVIRYFGGIKLGASKLQRVYRQTVNILIKNSQLSLILKLKEYYAKFNFSSSKQVDMFLNDKIVLTKKYFNEFVECSFLSDKEVKNNNLFIEIDLVDKNYLYVE